MVSVGGLRILLCVSFLLSETLPVGCRILQHQWSTDDVGFERTRRDASQPDGEPVPTGATNITDTLSQEDQLNGLCSTTYARGRDGRDGHDGRDGEPGQKGEAGDAGARGEPGTSGLKGTKGEAGQPGINATNPGSVGTTYVRWGRTICPSTAQLVYEGAVGGGYYTHIGGAANYICLPLDPDILQVDPGTSGTRGYIYTTEYQIDSFPPLAHLQNHDAPCVVCRVIGRSTKLMIAAKITCPSDWTSKYKGYLMSAHYDHAHQSDFLCVDENEEARDGTVSDTNGALLYLVEGECGAHPLPCPPYIAGNELPCVVCTV